MYPFLCYDSRNSRISRPSGILYSRCLSSSGHNPRVTTNETFVQTLPFYYVRIDREAAEGLWVKFIRLVFLVNDRWWSKVRPRHGKEIPGKPNMPTGSEIYPFTEFLLFHNR